MVDHRNSNIPTVVSNIRLRVYENKLFAYN